MSKIQDKLNKLKPYVVGIRYAEDILIVEAVFKSDWVLLPSKLIKTAPVEDGTNHHVFFSQEDGIGVDELLDYVENIIKINVERELKHEFLKAKVKELQLLFSKNTLDKLKTIKFVLGQEPLIPEDMGADDILSQISTDNIPVKEPVQTHATEEIKETIDAEDITPPIYETTQTTKRSNNKPNVELPPKGKKIEVEIHELPKELTEGTCNCGPDEYCPKCIDEKSM